MTRPGLHQIFSSVLALLLALNSCLSLAGCDKTGQTKSSTWPHEHSFQSYAQRRCSPASGPAAPQELWRKVIDLEKPRLDPRGGLVGLQPIPWEEPTPEELTEPGSRPAELQPPQKLLALDLDGDIWWQLDLPQRSYEWPGEVFYLSQIDPASRSLYCLNNQKALEGHSSGLYAGILKLQCTVIGVGVSAVLEPEGRSSFQNPLLGPGGSCLLTSNSAYLLGLEPTEQDIRTYVVNVPNTYDRYYSALSRDLKVQTEITDPAQSDANPEPGVIKASFVKGRDIANTLALASDSGCYEIQGMNTLLRRSTSGEVLWKQVLDFVAYGRPLVRVDDSVVVITFTAPPPDDKLERGDPVQLRQSQAFYGSPRELVCFDADGKEQWRYRSRARIEQRQALGDSGLLVYSERRPDGEYTVNGNSIPKYKLAIVAVDHEGKERYSFDTGIQWKSPFNVPGAGICIDGEANCYWTDWQTLISLDASGKERFRMSLGEGFDVPNGEELLLGADGHLLVCGKSAVLCLGDQ